MAAMMLPRLALAQDAPGEASAEPASESAEPSDPAVSDSADPASADATPPAPEPPQTAPPPQPPAEPEQNSALPDQADESTAVEDDQPEGLAIGQARLMFGARLMTGFKYEVEHPSGNQPRAGETIDDYGFFVQQARVGLDAKWKKRLRLQLDVEFERVDDPPAGIRDAWLNYRVDRAFQVKVGRFKRPFSRLELRGSGKLPMRGRGEGNGLIVEAMGFGDRSQGLELWGRLKGLDLDWYLSASDPPAANRGVDLHGRLEWDATDALEIGLGAAHKVFRLGEADPNRASNALGVDARFQLGELYVLVDGMFAQDARFNNRPNAGSVAAFASYDVSLGKGFALQPVVFGEWTDSNLEFSESEVTRIVAGLNLLWREQTFRIMPQVEIVRPLTPGDDTVWTEKESYYVMFSGEL